MSRIYDALQRAMNERNSQPNVTGDILEDPAFIPELDEPIPVCSEVIRDVPIYEWKLATASLPAFEHHGVAVEQFRTLRTRISGLRASAPLKTILVCSGLPGEGKTFVSVNLAISLAGGDKSRVLLIDGDLRRPSAHTLLGTANSPGLADFLAGGAQVSEIMQRGKLDTPEDGATRPVLSNLTFIASGKCGDNASELMAGHRLQELIASVSSSFDWIIIDSPPALAVSDALQMSRSADAVLLVARAGQTQYPAAQQTQSAFNGTRVIGVVLNDATESSRDDSRYCNYYYGQTDAGSAASIGS